MTYQYLSTAPTTARPLARHLPEAEAPKPYASLEDAIKAMKDEAKDIRQRQIGELRGQKGQAAPGTVMTDEDIIKAIKDNPHKAISELAAILVRSPEALRARLIPMEKSGVVSFKRVKPPMGRTLKKYYIPPKAQKLKTKTQRSAVVSAGETIDFIEKTPDCTIEDVASNFNLTKPAAWNRLSRARERQEHHKAKIITKRGDVTTYSVVRV